MNKEEFKEELIAKRDSDSYEDYLIDSKIRINKVGFYEGLNFAISLSEKLESLEKPVIPQFLADAINVYKENDGDLTKLLAGLEFEEIPLRYVYLYDLDALEEWYVDNENEDKSEMIAMAWMFGFETESYLVYKEDYGYFTHFVGGSSQPFAGAYNRKEDGHQFYSEEDARALAFLIKGEVKSFNKAD